MREAGTREEGRGTDGERSAGKKERKERERERERGEVSESEWMLQFIPSDIAQGPAVLALSEPPSCSRKHYQQPIVVEVMASAFDQPAMLMGDDIAKYLGMKKGEAMILLRAGGSWHANLEEDDRKLVLKWEKRTNLTN